MSETEERIVQNNLTFRAANEKIRAKAAEYDEPMERIPFLCECPDMDCTTIVWMAPSEYEAVRSNSKHFFTVTGHEKAEEPVGEVVSRQDGYVVVEKQIADLEESGSSRAYGP
ncbi:MAG: hypothetical protein H0W90_09610 [Actinobacteria bacterium]|nr:hypothetical protein [Actinomycetota bacterium]